MPYEALDRDRLVRALRRLGELAVGEAVELELSLYGGAVFTLVYGRLGLALLDRTGSQRKI